MDEIDLHLCQLLFANSRRPQRELADELGIGVAGVHRRIQSLMEQGVITSFTANLSTSYLKALHAQVDGVCDCKSVAENLDAIAKSGFAFSVLTSAANLTSVMLLLRSINDLGPTVELVRGALKMAQPKVTISDQGYPTLGHYKALTVVFDLKHNLARVELEADFYHGGLGVANNIAQRLLNDAE